MARNLTCSFSRRQFLHGMRWAPALLLPSPLHGLSGWPAVTRVAGMFPSPDFRFAPRYPAKPPLDDVLRLVTPGLDEFANEKYAAELMQLLTEWSQAIKRSLQAGEWFPPFLDTSLEFVSLVTAQEIPVRSQYGIEVFRRSFGSETVHGRERFIEDLKRYWHPYSKLDTINFEIIGIGSLTDSPLTVQAEIRYEIVGTRKDSGREQRIGSWRTRWRKDESIGWRTTSWRVGEEVLSRIRGALFADVTSQALGGAESYRTQLSYGVDHWRTLLDGASGIDVYGNNGVAVGDFDGDGFDDIYVCQPSGLPNRLYRNRGDGTFEDATARAGVDVLDPTACALFADFDNKGAQDLLVVCDDGPLLFLNEGGGKFSLKRDAFKFETAPQGNFTHAAIADYDHDGRLDVYFCLYNY